MLTGYRGEKVSFELMLSSFKTKSLPLYYVHTFSKEGDAYVIEGSFHTLLSSQHPIIDLKKNHSESLSLFFSSITKTTIPFIRLTIKEEISEEKEEKTQIKKNKKNEKTFYVVYDSELLNLRFIAATYGDRFLKEFLLPGYKELLSFLDINHPDFNEEDEEN